MVILVANSVVIVEFMNEKDIIMEHDEFYTKFNRETYSNKNPIFLNDNVWEEICKIEYNIGLIVDPNSCYNNHFCFVDGCAAFRIFPFNKKDGRWNYGSIDTWDVKTCITTSYERKYLNELIEILNGKNVQ